MKRNHATSSRWLIIVAAAVVYALAVGAVKKCSVVEESPPARPSAESKKPSKAKKTPAQVQPKQKPAPPPVPKPEPDLVPEPEPVPEPAEKTPPPQPKPSAEPVRVPQKEESLDSRRIRSNAVWSVCEAAGSGDIETLSARIREGESVNVHDEFGNTPLHLAAMGGHVEMVYALLNAKADPMATNKRGERPSEVAASAAVKVACEEGERPRRKEIALFDAVNAGQAEVVERALAEGVNPNALSGDNEHSLLTAAVRANQVEIARLLLQAGADVHYVEPNSRNALNYAAGGGNVALVELLLEAGADPLTHTNHGAYPIHDAIWSGKTAAAIKLIPYYETLGYNPDGKGNGYPVCMAIGRRQANVVQAFLEAGVDPNDPLFADKPLLVRAAQSGSEEIVRMLLKAGADKKAKDSAGKRAADYARGDLQKLLR